MSITITSHYTAAIGNALQHVHSPHHTTQPTHAPLSQSPTGMRSPAEIAHLYSVIQIMVAAACRHAIHAECIVGGKSLPNHPVWPSHGDSSRAWTMLENGRFVQVRRMPADNKLGYVYSDAAGLRGGTGGDDSGSAIKVSRDAVPIRNTDNTIGEATIKLELPTELFTNALWSGGDTALDKALIQTLLNKLPAVTWSAGRGNADPKIPLTLTGEDGSSTTYRMELAFKGNSGDDDVTAVPATARIYSVKISEDDSDTTIVLHEDQWLDTLLDDAEVIRPVASTMWRLPGTGKTVFLDRDIPCTTAPDADNTAKHGTAGKLLDNALLALTDGGACRHRYTAASGNGSYAFLDNGTFLHVAYQVGGPGTHKASEVFSLAVHDDTGTKLAAWNGIKDLDALTDSAGRNIMLEYYVQCTQNGKRELAPDDPHLQEPIALLRYLQDNKNMSALDFNAKPYEERRRLAGEYLEKEYPDASQRTGPLALLMPFQSAISKNNVGFSEPAEHVDWSKKIDNLDTLTDASSRTAMIEYYDQLAKSRNRLPNPDDSYLQEPITFLEHLEVDEKMSAADFKACSYEERRRLADEYLKAEYPDGAKRTGPLAILAPFLLEIRTDDGPPSDPKDKQWNQLIPSLKDLDRKPEFRAKLVKYYRALHVAGTEAAAIKSPHTPAILRLLRQLETPADLETLLTQSKEEREKELERLENFKPRRRLLTRFLEYHAGQPTVRTMDLPKRENNVKDFQDCIQWMYGISDPTKVRKSDSRYVHMQLANRWIRNAEKKGYLVGDLALDPDLTKIDTTVIDKLPHVHRSFQIWKLQQTYLAEIKNAKSDISDTAEGHLSAWLKWRQDSQMTTSGEGTGPSQLLDQMRTWPTDDRWDTHIENYLTANNVAVDERKNVRAMIDDFKDWCLNPELRATRTVQSSTATTSAQ
jgi:hypothetical protein